VSAPPAAAVPELASVSRSPAVVGPPSTATSASVDDSIPLLSHGWRVPGGAEPRTHTGDPPAGALSASRAAGTFDPLSIASRTRSVVRSRPTTSATCFCPSLVTTSTLVASPTKRADVSTPPACRTQTPDPRRVPRESRAAIATIDNPVLQAPAGAVEVTRTPLGNPLA